MQKYFQKIMFPFQKGSIDVFVIFGMFITLAIVIGAMQSSLNQNDEKKVAILQPSPPDIERPNLHLNTLGLITVTPSPKALLSPPSLPSFPPISVNSPTPTAAQSSPPPTDVTACRKFQDEVITGTGLSWGINPETGQKCVMDGPAEFPQQCCPGVPLCENGRAGSGVCSIHGNPCPVWCDAKPVIYLYPQKPTFVNVTLTVPGSIVESDPLYPKEGWKNILAYPNGKLLYNGKTYHELFYEASVTPIKPPQTAIVVSLSSLRQTLISITTQLGLLPVEQEEFLQYWVPKLQKLQSPYILVSFFSPAAKDQIDHVDIVPKPDTFLQFIMYYKPIKYPTKTTPLQLPNQIPQRKGFTAVEWGGIIDY